MKKMLGLIALMVWTTFLFAQEQTVKGKVISKSDGQPIPGVSVSVKGTTSGTITNIDGEYSLTTTDGSVLLFSFIGMTSQEVVPVGGTANVTLVDEIAALNEVVVVGYGVQKKSLVTGAIAKINGSTLTQSTAPQVTAAMQGKTAGVVIASQSGQPGAKVSVSVRGVGTNGSPQPLYIVDGLPMSGDGLDFVNSADVQSVEVLKDAASCAIYGARGANGVIIITTKSGKKDTKMTISYDGFYGVQNAWKELPTLNSEQYMMLVNEANMNDGAAPTFTDEYKASHEMSDTNWQQEMYNKNAVKQNHSISINGGSDKVLYSTSLNYFKQDGIVAPGKSGYEKFSYRINSDAHLGFLSFGTNINLAHINSQGVSENGSYGLGLNQATNMPPVVPVKMADGTWGTPSVFGLGTGEITNPIALLEYQNSRYYTNKMAGGLSTTFDFGHLANSLKGLTFRSSINGDFALVDHRTFTPEFFVDNVDTQHYNDKGNITTRSFEEYVSGNFDNVLTYDKQLDIHHFTVMLGAGAYENTYNSLNGSKRRSIYNDYSHAYLDNATESTTQTTGGGYSDHTVASLFGRINYDFNSKYMVSATVRRDGSSRFGSNNKYGYFPSVSGGWVISNEGFMKSAESFVDMLKLRVSWGQNGNENFGDRSDFRYVSTMANNKYYYFGDPQVQNYGTVPASVANPDLRWETSEQLNFGLDFVGLKGKFNATLDYYIKTTKDWLVEAPIAMVVGNNGPVSNLGNVENKGVEFEFGWKDKVSVVDYAVSINGAFNKNEVTSLANSEARILGGNGANNQGAVAMITPGLPLGTFWGLKTNGIFQNQAQVDAYVNSEGVKLQPLAKPGDIIFVDYDGNGIIDPNLDRTSIGSPYPTFTGGLNLSASAYGFDVSAFLYTALGQKIYNATRLSDKGVVNWTAEWTDRWTGEGTSNKYPRVTEKDVNGNLANVSDFYIQDGSYLRLKTLTLGYTLPKAALSAIKVNNVRIYVSGENLVTLTGYKGYDPEIGGGVLSTGVDYGVYPQARTILGGINVTF